MKIINKLKFKPKAIVCDIDGVIVDSMPYLKAAKGLKVKPGECVVIENAPYGVLSAKRAGMFCIALTSSLPPEYLKRADIIADNFDEISALVNSKRYYS